MLGIKKYRRCASFLLTLITAAFAPFGLTQEPVRLVVPFAAGGTQDLVARTIQRALGEALGETVIVENRAGAGGTVGTAAVAASLPNGKTMALVASNHTSAPWLYPKAPYDALKSFAPVALIGKTGFALVMSSDVPANNVPELIAYARRNPGRLNYASPGNGSNGHLGMALFVHMAGIQAQHIPFKSTGEAVTDVLAGRSQLVMPATIGALPMVGDKRVKILGMTSKFGRTGAFGAYPQIGEKVLPGFSYEAWYGILMPSGTPKARVDQVHVALVAAMSQAQVRESLIKAGVEPLVLGPSEFAGFLAQDYEQTGKLIKVTGARVE